MRVAIVMLACASCDWSLHRMQEPVGCREHGTTSLLPNRSCDLEPPDGVVAIDPPAVAPRPTRELLVRGRDRYERMCGACHGLAADGDSYVARMMTLRRPPSLVDATASSLTDDRILGVIATGYGVMPGYAAMIAPSDRYAILHYVRALQHRDVAFDELSAREQEEARAWLR